MNSIENLLAKTAITSATLFMAFGFRFLVVDSKGCRRQPVLSALIIIAATVFTIAVIGLVWL